MKKKRKCQNPHPPPKLCFTSQFLPTFTLNCISPPLPLPCLLFTLAVPLLVAMA